MIAGMKLGSRPQSTVGNSACTSASLVTRCVAIRLSTHSNSSLCAWSSWLLLSCPNLPLLSLLLLPLPLLPPLGLLPTILGVVGFSQKSDAHTEKSALPHPSHRRNRPCLIHHKGSAIHPLTFIQGSSARGDKMCVLKR